MSIDAIGHFGSGRIARAIASTSDQGSGQSIEDLVRFEQLKHRSADRGALNHDVSYSQETISYDLPRHPVSARLYQTSDYKLNCFETSNTLSNKSLPNDQNIRCYDHGCDGRGFSSVGNFVRHQREKSDKANRFICHFCGQLFTRQTARNLHVSRRRCKIWRPGFGAASCNETAPQEFVNGSEYSTAVSSEGAQYQFFKSRLGSDETLAMTNSISGYDFFTATQSN